MFQPPFVLNFQLLNLIRRVWQFACRPFSYQHFTGNPAKGTRKTNFPRYQRSSKSYFIRSFSFARWSKTSSQSLVLPLKPRGNFSQSLWSCFVWCVCHYLLPKKPDKSQAYEILMVNILWFSNLLFGRRQKVCICNDLLSRLCL